MGWQMMLLDCKDSVVQWLKAHRCTPLATPWPSCSTLTLPYPTVDLWLPTHLRNLQARALCWKSGFKAPAEIRIEQKLLLPTPLLHFANCCHAVHVGVVEGQ